MSNSRILKNSAFLYLRLLITLALGLFTTRIVINALGIADYGIYGVVAGLITMFGFMNAAMSSSTQRYLSFDLGLKDSTKLQQTFTTAVNIHLLIGVVTFLLAEGVGLWAVNHLLDIPEDRLGASNIAFQFSLIAFFFGIIQVPYHAAIIAYERMNAYAYISIVEAVLKLSAAYLLMSAPFDRMIFYSQLLALISFICFTAYYTYVKVQFKGVKYIKYFDKRYYKEILSFSGWNLFGNIAAVSRNQGLNILLNIFFGVAVNAAYAVAMMIQGVLTQFAASIQQAINPQIIKSYAERDCSRASELISLSSKYAFFLLLLPVIPFYLNLEFVLYAWLGDVPGYASSFVSYIFIFILVEIISLPLVVGIQAAGKVKVYQLSVSSVIILVLPIAYVCLDLGYREPDVVFALVILSSVAAFFVRLYFVKKFMSFDGCKFFRESIVRISYVLMLVLPVVVVIDKYNDMYGIHKVVIDCIYVGLIIFFSVYFFGMNAKEKNATKLFIMMRLREKGWRQIK